MLTTVVLCACGHAEVVIGSTSEQLERRSLAIEKQNCADCALASDSKAEQFYYTDDTGLSVCNRCHRQADECECATGIES